tara:strand:+ start:887 stop:1030 length:144 start_codon:yes stop_codon:yes gene_type:complete
LSLSPELSSFLHAEEVGGHERLREACSWGEVEEQGLDLRLKKAIPSD